MDVMEERGGMDHSRWFSSELWRPPPPPSGGDSKKRSKGREENWLENRV
jgi:hypothetical protein